MDAKYQTKHIKLSSMYQQELNKTCEKYLSFKSSTTLAQQKCQFESGKK